MTSKYYIEQSMPMVERLFIRKLYKNYELKKTLHDIDLTLDMGPFEAGKETYNSSDEDEKLLLVFARFFYIIGNNE